VGGFGLSNRERVNQHRDLYYTPFYIEGWALWWEFHLWDLGFHQTPEDRAGTNSIALFYLSVWKNAATARAFSQLYADNLGRKYSSLKLESDSGSGNKADHSSKFKVFPPPPSSGEDSADSAVSDASALPGEQVYSTSEGPVVITTRDKMVFVSESFPLDVARKLTTLILDAQGTGAIRQAQVTQPDSPDLKSVTLEPLTGNLVRFFSDCGVMKAAVDGAMKAAK